MTLISLIVKTIDGKDSIVHVDPELPLDHLRQTIETTTGISKSDQRLIFRGRILKDELRSLGDHGFVDGLAVHVVTKAPPKATSGSATESRSSEASQSQQLAAVPQITTQNLIVGQVVLERTSVFEDPNVAMEAVTRELNELRGAFQLETEASLQTNTQDGSFVINVILRGMRGQIVNGPARERFESIKLEVKKLAWLIALVKAQFNDRIDTVFSCQEEPAQREAYRAIGDILLAMNAFDHFDEAILYRFTERDEDRELIALIQELNTWQLPDDEAHLQNLNRNTVVRHCLSMDLSRLLVFLSLVDAKFNEHLMSRFNLVLAHRHNLQSSSYSARLMNCFSSAVSRIQHARAHIYHSVSDIGIHVDDNGMNRLFPQLLHYERATEPPQADITFIFLRAGVAPFHPLGQSGVLHQQHRPASHERRAENRPDPLGNSRASDQQNNSTTFNSLVSGFMSVAQQLLGGASGQNSQQQQQPQSSTSNVPPRLASRSASFGPRFSSRAANSSGVVGHFPRPFHHAQNHQLRFPVGLPPMHLNQAPPTAPNSLFVGPLPPLVFPNTFDQFLTCSSRRYRLFECDSRHSDFWNDPETVRLGILPPSNSVTAFENRLQQTQSSSFDLAPNGNFLGRMPHNHHRQLNADLRPRDFNSAAVNNDNNQMPNEHGEAAFNAIEDFVHFVRQMFGSVAQSMTQNDISTVLSNTADAPGFVPSAVHPFPSREADGLNTNLDQGQTSTSISSESFPQNAQQQPTPPTD